MPQLCYFLRISIRGLYLALSINLVLLLRHWFTLLCSKLFHFDFKAGCRINQHAYWNPGIKKPALRFKFDILYKRGWIWFSIGLWFWLSWFIVCGVDGVESLGGALFLWSLLDCWWVWRVELVFHRGTQATYHLLPSTVVKML